jgi:hypothetical protein
MLMVDVIGELIHALAENDIKLYTTRIQNLEDLAAKYAEEKAEIFTERSLTITTLDEVVVTKFFPMWRKLSKATGKCIIMPGDEEGQYKVMTDTSSQQIATTKDEVFTHTNGFISVVAPKEDSTHIGIALTDGSLIEVSIKEIDNILNRKDYR